MTTDVLSLPDHQQPPERDSAPALSVLDHSGGTPWEQERTGADPSSEGVAGREEETN